MNDDEITQSIIASAIKVHKKLGPGLLESAYQQCLAYELQRSGWFIETQKHMPLIYDELRLEHGYRIDILVENKIVIEIKAVDAFNRVHFDQLLTYLRLGNFRLGLLVNFHVSLLKDGIKRIIN